MKQVLLITIVFVSIAGSSQTNLKNGCSTKFKPGKEKTFVDSIISNVPSFKFVTDTFLKRTASVVYVYKNSSNDELQIWFDKTDTSIVFDKIVSTFSIAESLYKNYFGRQTDLLALSKNKTTDNWKPECNGKKLWITFKPMIKEGYWQIDF